MPEKKYFIISESAPDSGPFRLTGDEAHHLLRVSRVKPGESIALLDGRGGVYDAVLKRGTGADAELDIVAYTKAPPPSPVDMALALTKAPRFDIAVEKCTELGLRGIIPLESERTVRRGEPGAAEKRRLRLERKVIAACKQSGQPYFPHVAPIIGFEELIESLSSYTSIYLADREGDNPVTGISAPGRCAVLGVVGPEGGFTEGERSALIEAGARAISLGPSRLRSETAAICLAFAIVNAS
jgi:16S rRNA (uracil1498-N3)-methyltransferase